MEAREKYKGVNSIKFYRTFNNDEACYRYIAGIKWDDTNYKCKKCGNTKYCKGKKPYSRRCIKCGFDESPKSGTICLTNANSHCI